ncbi:MAG: hypothetical protein AAF203_02445 [Pseudomonadota bacterium]
MSVLARYRKPGGFRQLLQLIETSQPAKQAKLIEVIQREDPHWARLIEKKKITCEMVLKWDADHLALIIENMVENHAACLFHIMEDNSIMAFETLIRPEKYRRLRSLFENMEEPKPQTQMAAKNHLLETVRFLDEEKKIILRFIDPKLDLSEAA